MLRRLALPAAFLALLLPACANDDALVLADAAHDAAASAAVKQLLVAHAADFHAAVLALQADVPPPSPTGWSHASNPAAVDAMRADWKKARVAFEALEGANDLYFPTFQASLDLRYEQVLAIGPVADLFDGVGFVGLHAVERILWADAPPSTFEQTLPGYAPASFPTDGFSSSEFHDNLCARLVDDAASLETAVRALSLDSPGAYETAIHLVKDQITKINEAGAGRDESRYAGFTLADMRANLAAAQATQGAFHDWLVSKQASGAVDGGATASGSKIDAAIASSFAQLACVYTSTPGEGLSPPAGWSSTDPTGAMVGTPFGGLFLTVSNAVDETSPGSLLNEMGQVIEVLGISPSTAQDGGTDAGGPPKDDT